jgi:glyoxylase-like metal-dependent hydrolase (beta-lactamase superfamily II)
MRCASALTLLLAFLLLPSGLARAGTELAPGVHFLPGRFVAGTQPDGNTVIFTAPAGLIVVDTGRHVEHTQTIIDFATARKVPVAAIVNTHWHLDHIGGNARLRRDYPDVKIYASGALSQALTGFLANYRTFLVGELGKAETDSATRATFGAELALIEAGPALAPDSVVTAPGERTIAGKVLRLGLETYSVTAGDVWLFDPATRILVAGDLVTLPAPFFDTACPEHWKGALDRLAGVDFEVLVPGHGPPLRRAAFDQYPNAFDRLLACAATDSAKAACIEGWVRDAGTLVPEEDRKLARSLLDYYLDTSLRADSTHTAALCGP